VSELFRGLTLRKGMSWLLDPRVSTLIPQGL